MAVSGCVNILFVIVVIVVNVLFTTPSVYTVSYHRVEVITMRTGILFYGLGHLTEKVSFLLPKQKGGTDVVLHGPQRTLVAANLSDCHRNSGSCT